MKKIKVKKFGILTSGGDAPGLNAAIRGVCRAAITQYGMKIMGIHNGYRGLVEGDAEELHVNNFSGILTRGGTILGTSRDKPLKNPVKDPKTGLLPLEAIKANIKKWDLDALVVLGGNGTNTTASLLAKEGVNIIGLPKTIDNDIVHTDITFGFHTALEVATEAVDRIHTTAHSHNRVMLIEVMGHKAGWLALYSGVAGGADVILIPEIPYNIKSVAKEVKRRSDEGKQFSIIVVAEGALSKEEALLSKKELKSKREAMTYSIAYRVARELKSLTQLESRVTVLGYLQRGGTPSPYDRVLATQFGVAAADFLAKGKFGKLVAIQNGQIVGVPLEDIADKIKKIPNDDPLLITGRSLGINFGD
ncbi:6-phosphofructokinase [Treponema parvum]|uniref:ATP-dependent 6-phosphofructokinase n=1 Tax=Treponema parvum TaxID=138851 RepID=A0A975F636_9SPIR|nr:ATP-dependent 6-phosphofructokinase [Treponema parvum]QTQ15025.1 6-phosphofructokinase [Treponema parvum]